MAQKRRLKRKASIKRSYCAHKATRRRRSKKSLLSKLLSAF